MKINSKLIDLEDFGDEIVFIHIENGSYFSLKGKAIEIFRLLVNDCKKEDILSLIKSKYDVEEQKRIQEVLLVFESQGLFVENEKAEEFDWQEDTTLGHTQFIQHNDMNDLIKLDPIHDVSDKGWPHAK